VLLFTVVVFFVCPCGWCRKKEIVAPFTAPETQTRATPFKVREDSTPVGGYIVDDPEHQAEVGKESIIDVSAFAVGPAAGAEDEHTVVDLIFNPAVVDNDDLHDDSVTEPKSDNEVILAFDYNPAPASPLDRSSALLPRAARAPRRLAPLETNSPLPNSHQGLGRRVDDVTGILALARILGTPAFATNPGDNSNDQVLVLNFDSPYAAGSASLYDDKDDSAPVPIVIDFIPNPAAVDKEKEDSYDEESSPVVAHFQIRSE
jgi:hypothetical protein